MSQTGVSTETTTLNTLTLPFRSPSPTGAPRPARAVKSGALSPTFTSFPSRVTGLPFIFTTSGLSFAILHIPPQFLQFAVLSGQSDLGYIDYILKSNSVRPE